MSAAGKFHEALEPVADAARMSNVAGYGQPTWVDVRDFARLGSPEGYTASRFGDGTVPHRLGLLFDPAGNPIPTFNVPEEHSKLPHNLQVRQSLDDLLLTGATTRLVSTLPAGVRGVESDLDRAAAAQALVERSGSNLAALAEIQRQLDLGAAEPPAPSHLEQIGCDLLAEAFFASGGDPRRFTAAAEAGAAVPHIPTVSAGTRAVAHRRHRIPIRVVCAGIEEVEEPGFPPPPAGFAAPQAVCIGQYVGVRPPSALLAIDRAVSSRLPGADPDFRIITEMIDRGLLRGELAEPFFLPDPRDERRLIAVFGMGRQGSFGVPELSVLVHQICWSLARIGRRHVATVLIGSAGVIDLADAVEAWLRGLHRALSGAAAKPMYAAMREARLSIAGQAAGARTWGAYQHYGNPYFRFFRSGPGSRRHVDLPE